MWLTLCIRNFMIQHTSLLAHKEVKPKIGKMQQTILNVITELPNISNLEIARTLGWPINSVTPRVKELRDLELVEDAGLKKDPLTSRTVHGWKRRIQTKEEQLNLI